MENKEKMSKTTEVKDLNPELYPNPQNSNIKSIVL